MTHPKHWMMCGPCQVSGKNGNIGECDKCQGNGFKVMMDGKAR
jgi:hypothetical protein